VLKAEACACSGADRETKSQTDPVECFQVETRWNSTFQMLHRLVELREPVSAPLASLETDLSMLTSEESTNVTGCISLLSPFNETTVELSQEKWSLAQR